MRIYNDAREGTADTRLPNARNAGVAVLFALFLVALLPAGASATAPSILNTAIGCNSSGGNGSGTVNQMSWLVSCASQGHDGDAASGRRTRISALISHDKDKSIDNFLTDEWGNSTVTRGVNCQSPTIQGGYGRSRCDLVFTHNNNGTGLSGSTLGSCGTDSDRRYTFDKVLGLRAEDSASVNSATSSSVEKFVAADHSTGCTEAGSINTWNGIGTNTGTYGDCSSPNTSATDDNFNISTTPGSQLTFCYKGNYPGGGEYFNGIRWRLRNLRDGTKTGTTDSCPGGGDNSQKGLKVTFPDRGAWVVEGQAMYGSSATAGCGTVRLSGFWFPIGSANVNSAAAPTFDLSASRPQLNGNTTVTAENFLDPDSDDGGGVQILEWDLDGNTSNGVSGFEATPTIATSGNSPAITADQTKTVSTSGQTPGLHTVRVRATDNGAMDAADSVRKTRIVSATYLVDSPPVATAQSVTAETGTDLPITLSATDANGDAQDYTIQTGPAHGTLSGTGANQTYTSDPGYSGADSFTFQADDGYGGTSTATVNVAVEPNTVIDSAPTGTIDSRSATISFHSDADSATFECSVDGDAYAACSSPFTTSVLDDGPHTFSVRASANLTDSTPAEADFTVDASPSVSITSGPNGPIATDSATFEFTAGEAGNPGGVSVECQLDDGGYSPCSSPQTYNTLSEGPHTFDVRGTDGYGKQGTASQDFTVDLTPPDTTIDSGPPDPTNDETPTLTFSSSETGSTFECDVDGGGFSACSSPFTTDALGAGSHTFSVRATDVAGNTDGSPASSTFFVDLTPPVTTIDSGPADGSTIGTQTPTFEFSSNESGGTFECSVDGDAFALCSSPYTTATLAGGPHSFSVRAVDAAGNADPAPPTRNFTVDLGAPETTIDTGPDDGSTIADATPTFGFSADDPDATFECAVDSDPFTSCSTPYTTAGLSDGSHTFSVRATDEYANTDPTPASRTFTVDTTGPDTVIDTAPAALINTASATFTFHSPEGSATFECSLDSAPFTACDSPKTYTGLSEGPHSVDVRAVDTVGNPDPTPADASFTVDTVAPETTIDSGPSGPTADNTPTFTFSSSETGSTFECRIDADSFAPCTTPFTAATLSDGPHTLYVRATDSAENTDPSPASQDFSVDTTGPDTNITDNPPAITNQTTASFSFDSPESPVTFECQLDSGSWSACTSPKSYSGLAAGSHTFSVRALDALGNPDPTPATYTWMVDLTPPDTVIDTAPAARTASTTAEVTFHSTKTGSTFECKLDAGAFAPCTSPKDYSGLADGPHTIQVRATDGAGNTDATPASATFTVDTTGPVTTINSGPSGRTANASPSFGFTANETATFECQIDSGGFTPCTSPKAYTSLADGPHTFSVRGTDDLNNVGNPATRTFTVDTIGPTVSIDTGPAALINASSATVTFSSSSSDIASYECQLDAGPYVACTTPKTYNALSEGSHTINVHGIDDVGNTGAAASRTFTVDTIAPDTVIDSGPSGTEAVSTASFTFHSTETPATFECKIDAGAFASCTSPKAYSGLSDGPHTFSVRATDAALNTDATPATQNFTVDTTPPDTTINYGPSGRTANAFPAYGFSSTETGSTFECQVDSAAFAACTSPTTIGRLSDGPHTFTVRATDAVGNTDPTPASRSITVDTTGPDATINSGPSGQVNSAAASFTFTTPESGATFECQLDGSAFTACTSPQSYASLSEGAHVFRVRALDDLGNPGTSDQRNFTVDTIAPDTVIDSGPQGPTNDVTPSFSFHSTETGSTFECKLDSGAFEACSSPRAYGPLAEGPHTFTVRATDGATNTDQTPASSDFTVDTTVPETSIDSGPSGPTADNTPTYEFSSPDATATFQCRTDSDAFAACASPFTTAALADGDHTFEVRAVDPAGNIDQTPDSRSITVDTTAPETTIDSGVSGPTTNTTPSFTFSSEAGATFECKIDSAAYAPCDSPFTAPEQADGPHTFSVRATDTLGNTDQSPDTRSFTVDTTGPDTTIDSKPDALTNAASDTFTFSASEGSVTFECKIDGEDFTACSSPMTYTGLGDGQHTFKVRALDALGNPDPTPDSYTWTRDTTPPNTTINFGPQGPTSNTAPTFGFSSTEAGSTFECRVDSDAFSPCTSPKTIAAQTPGAHTFSVRATDPAANTDPTPATRSFTVDVTGPSSQIDTGPDGLTNDPSPTFTFSSSKPNSTFNCQVDGGAVSPCSSPFTVSPDLADGDHTFDVQAIDSAGNTETGFSRATFTVDATAPETTITDQPPATSNNPDPSFAFSSEPGATFECKLDSAAYAPCSSPQDYTGLAAGPHTFSVRATDSAANTDQTPASADFTIDTAAPDTSIDTGPSGTTNVADPTFTFSSSEANSTFECQVDSDAFAPCTSPLHLSALSEGEHTFSVRATDASENTDPSAATRTFTVDTTAPETTIDSATLSGTSATATFHSEAGATFECKLDSGAFSPCTSPKTFSGLTPGDHTIAVRATDTAGNTDQTPDTRTVTVADVTPPPDTTAPETTITEGPAQGSTTTDHRPSLSFTSTEAGSTFECSLNGGAFSPCSAPKALANLADGAQNFQVRATDAAGNTDPTPASRSWTVTTDKPAVAVPPKFFPRRGTLKVARGGRVVVATIFCPQGICTVRTPARVNMKIDGRSYPAKVKVSKGIREGGKVKIKLILPAVARRALAVAGKGKVKVPVSVTSSDGKSIKRHVTWTLKPAKRS